MRNATFAKTIHLALAPLACLLASGASGQDDARDDAVFELSPFEVTTEDDGSYMAKNAISATKFDMPLKDIPVAMQVITEAFMDDTFSLDLESSMEYSAAVSPNIDQGGTRESGVFSIRGFRAARVKRDGVIAYYSQEMTNIARVEVMKGPASLLYGEAQPGGIINYVPKRPLDEPRYGVTLSTGSDGFYRGELEATGPLIKTREGKTKLLYRLDASYMEEDGWKASEWEEKSFASGVLEYRFTPRMKVSLSGETLDRERVTIHGFPYGGSLTREQWAAFPDEAPFKSLGSSQSGGVAGSVFIRNTFGAPMFNDFGSFNGDPRIRTDSIGRGLVIMDELARLPYDFVGEHPDDINRTKRDLYTLDFQTPLLLESWFLQWVTVRDETNLFIRESRPLRIVTYSGDGIRYGPFQFSATDFENDTTHHQMIIKGNWDLFGIRNQTVLGGERREDSFRAYFWQSIAPKEVTTEGELVQPISDTSRPFIPPNKLLPNVADLSPKTPVRSDASSTDFRDPISEGYYFSNLASFYKDQFKLLFGMRYDRAYQETIDLEGNLVEKSPVSKETTPQYGLIYGPFESLAFYYSHSESFVPDNGNLRRYNRETKEFFFVSRDPVKGLSDEFGFKLDLFDSRLSGTVSFYEIEQTGVVSIRQTGLFEDPPTNSRAITEQYQDGSSFSKGMDIDVNYAPWPNLQMVFGYSYIDSETTLSAAGQLVSFKNTVGVPDHQGSLWSKYTFTEGSLDGFSVGLGIIYNGKRRLFSPTTNGLAQGFDDISIYGKGYFKFDTRLAYSMQLRDGKLEVALNVKNVTDKKAFLSSALPIAPRQAYLTLTYKF